MRTCFTDYTPLRGSLEEEVTTPVTRFQRLGERSRQASTSNEHNEIPIPTAQPEHDTVQGRAAAALVRAATAPSVLDLQMGTPEELAFLQREAPNLEEWAADLDDLDFAEPETRHGGSGGDDAGQLRGSQQTSHTAEGSYEGRRSAGSPSPSPPQKKSPAKRKYQRKSITSQVSNVSKEKNRAAQRRFREKQRAKVEALEESMKDLQDSRAQMKLMREAHRQQEAALADQVSQLQLERNHLHSRESKIMDLMSELAEIRAGGAAGREGRLQDIVFEANNLRCGADSFDLDWFMTKLLLFINPSDFDATEPAVLSLLQHPPRGAGARVRPSQLRMTLQQAANARGEPRLVSVAQLMHMSHEAFLSLYATYSRALADLGRDRPALEFVRDPLARKLVSELRGLMCCFNAIHSTHGPLQQLRHAVTWQIVDDQANSRVLSKILENLNLSGAQLTTVQQAALKFRQHQARTQAERRQLLPALQAPLYGTASMLPSETARMLDAAARLRKNQEDDTFNVCRLTTFFATQVASDEQIIQLTVEAYPHSLNIMGIIQCCMNYGSVLGPHALA